MMRALALLAFGALGASTYAQLFTDDFNRANSANLGPNWQLISGGAVGVLDNEAANTVGNNNLTLVVPGAFSAPYHLHKVSADVRTTDATATLTFAAIALAHNGSTSKSSVRPEP
jgi:hypothetical protein